jgi:RNA polymerase sigma factor (sigma-70 family)
MSDRTPTLFPTADASADLTGASDAELFGRYQAGPCGEVFRALAARHLPLIWSTARRLVNGDAALAEDVAQIVLTDFARKAPQLPPGTVAAGWLHRHTCFTARKLVRTEVRRRAREQRASFLSSSLSNSSGAGSNGDSRFPSVMAMTSTSDSDSESLWQEAAPLLDAALDGLDKADREAILLRFYQRQDHRSIGTAMGCTEDAARKRVARALEKLRTLFRRRGVLLTAALLSQCLTDHATAAVPASVAASLPGLAWRQAVTGGPIAAASVWMMRLRRWALPTASVAVLVVAGGFWVVTESGWFGGGKHPAYDTSQAAAFPASTAATNAGPELLFRYTIADLSAKFLAVRLLTWESSAASDAALFEEVRGLAKSGGSLEEFDLSGPLNRQLQLEKTKPHDLPSEWVWDQEKDIGKPTSMDTRSLGTIIGSTARESEDGSLEVVWQIRHHYAEPEAHAWPIALEKSASDPARSIRMEDLHEAAAEGRNGDVRINEPRLLFIQHLPAAVLPDAAPEPRTLLLFVTVNPS